MADYKTMYYELAGKVADAIELLEKAMQDGELKYMLSGNHSLEDSTYDGKETANERD